MPEIPKYLSFFPNPIAIIVQGFITVTGDFTIMVKVKTLAQATMTEEKKKIAKKNVFAFYVGRTLSYVLTIPFLEWGISPNAVSLLSLVPVIAGIVLPIFAKNLGLMYVCWACFFLWNLLDGVDGNIARYTGKSSVMGSVYDAMSGYAATAAIYLSWGIAADRFPGLLNCSLFENYNLFIIIGALSSLTTLFPRLIMQKVLVEVGKKSSDDIKSGSLMKDIVLNFTSVSGFIQVIMLISIPLKMFDLFTVIYFVINSGLMIVTIRHYLNALKGR